jgi:hypothetical protein
VRGNEFVAVTSGTVPRVGVGLLTTLPDCDVCSVWIEEADDDRAGLLARPTPPVGPGAGTGFGLVKEGDGAFVGVGRGVLFDEELVDRVW